MSKGGRRGQTGLKGKVRSTYNSLPPPVPLTQNGCPRSPGP